MAQRKPEQNTTLEQVLKLADQLTAEEQERLIEEMKLRWLRRELGKAADSLDRGEGKPANQVFNAVIEQLKKQKG